MTSRDTDEPHAVHEGSLGLKGRVFFCTRWRRKYVTVRADTRQLAIYDKKVSASSTGKRGECLLIQLKHVVECKAVESSKKKSSFFLQKSANAGSNRKIIFRCPDPADRDRWINVINDVMNDKISGRCAEFDDVVVSSDALTHLGKTRPKPHCRRPPGRRAKAGVSSPKSDVSSFGDDADSGVGASSELLTAHPMVPKADDIEVTDGIIQQTPTSQESVQHCTPNRQVSTTESLSDIEEIREGVSKKSEKLSSLQRLRRQKKSIGGSSEAKTQKVEKNASMLGNIKARISRAFSSGSSQKSDVVPEKRDSKRVAKDADVADRSDTAETAEKAENDDAALASREIYAISSTTKSGQDKVIQELAAIAQNAKLVAQKAEALKTAIKEEGETSGEESAASGAGKSLSRRDSETNIEQAAQNLRTTLKNLSEAEVLATEQDQAESAKSSEDSTYKDLPESDEDDKETSDEPGIGGKKDARYDQSDADSKNKPPVLEESHQGNGKCDDGISKEKKELDAGGDSEDRERNTQKTEEVKKTGEKDVPKEGENDNSKGTSGGGCEEAVTKEKTVQKAGEKDVNANQGKEMQKVGEAKANKTVLTNGTLSDEDKLEP